MALHFIEKYGMMALRIPSKFDMRRFCRATNATALTKLSAPSPADLGFAKHVVVREIGNVNCVVLQQVGLCVCLCLFWETGRSEELSGCVMGGRRQAAPREAPSPPCWGQQARARRKPGRGTRALRAVGSPAARVRAPPFHPRPPRAFPLPPPPHI